MEEISDFLTEESDPKRERSAGGEGWREVVFTVGELDEEERGGDG